MEARDEAAPELGVLGERGAPVPGRVEPAHQRSVDLLRERLERSLAPGERHGSAQIARLDGRRRERLEQRDDALAMVVLRLERPLVAEIRQQVVVAKRERVRESSLRPQALGLEDVDRRLRREPDAFARRDEGVFTERAPERPERAAQARARALVEHVGPEDRRDGCPRMEAGMKREPRQERARPSGRKRAALAVDLCRDLSHESQLQHRQSVQPDD